MGWHIELQCDTRECQVLSDGVLGTSVKTVSAEARSKGWIQDINGLWRCPICAPAFAPPGRSILHEGKPR